MFSSASYEENEKKICVRKIKKIEIDILSVRKKKSFI